jgi:outer membrane protein OmpA-like peptidoglycan-associated protein
VTLLLTALTGATNAYAQTPQTPSESGETRPALTTASGTTGLWFVPTGEVLPSRRWSVSLYRVNMDDGQGFTDVSYFPVTFAVGLGNRAELFGSWSLVTRIDRDSRPLFFTSSSTTADTGSGGGIYVNHPQARQGWSGNKLGDFWVGGKISFTPNPGPVAVAVRGMVKLPVGDEDSGASSGKADVAIDGIVSGQNSFVELSGYGGVMVRGNPSGFQLTNGLRWGVGAAFPQRASGGLRITAELFGEQYFDDVVTAPSGFTAVDGSIAPLSSQIKSPIVTSFGVTWQAPNGFFVGAAASWNLSMKDREDAAAVGQLGAFENEPFDDSDIQVRLGFHPGARSRRPPPPEPVVTPAPPPPPPPPANRPPTVKASCDPCTVEVGKAATVTADAQDPDGDPLTYQWTAKGGTLAMPTSRQSSWTAPMQEGPVPFTVQVNDGRGGTAQATTTIQVVRPPVKQYTFEDVHFEFDRSTLRQDALQVLDGAIAAMKENPTLQLQIEGHTCNIGTAEYNLALGNRRAESVRDYLVSRGVAATRLATVSYGEERPRHDNDREETRRLNRRAALVVRLQ